MYCLMLLLATLVASCQVFCVPIEQREAATEESIKSNLIDYESDLIEGLTPPVLEAENYFTVRSAKSEAGFENPYVVEIHRKYLNIKTTGLPEQKIKLNQTETEGIQKLSLAFVELLNSSKLAWPAVDNGEKTYEWNDLNPVIVLTNSGISIQFLNSSDTDSNATEVSSSNKFILWDFLANYAKNIFEEKLKQLKESETFAEVLESPIDETKPSFENFIKILWNIMKVSVTYAEASYGGWTTSQPEMAVPEKKVRSTTATLFAYEEPSPFHEFPSQEFLFRRKDIDSIFYGRGVI